jgi:hypothetical protein
MGETVGAGMSAVIGNGKLICALRILFGQV